MNTFLSRLNTVFAFTLTVLAGLTFLCFISTVFLDYQVKVDISTQKALVRHVPDFSVSREKNDLGFITFDLKTDILLLFNWNTKQLFIYVTAEYETQTNKFNQVVVWDKIILRSDNSQLNYQGMNTKYYFFDDGSGLKGNRNISLHLSWNVIPTAGILPLISGSQDKFKFNFPDAYTPIRQQ
ncbi:predicted protein [Nematostella vectensis]|uniref:Signal peptidase complex subunit 3 n=1 Tax=Nematostella vectensis TaxID=45351 RepID=A7RVL8_NEMVE|nr:predicted protein [Nematostella vectensis]|eukprot:XP_001636471.1 predicted protein [Nematostella vectensis]